MTAISESIEINRSPEDVFAYLDDVERHGEWQDQIVGGRRWAAFRVICAQHSIHSEAPRQDSLLGVEPVLGLIPDDGLGAVDDGRGHLEAAVGRQAMHEYGPWGRRFH